MNKKNIILLLTFFISTVLLANTQTTNNEEPLIYFNLKEDPLNEIINRIAAYKQANIILPGTPTEQKKLVETKVTFKISHKIKVSHAWEMVITMLDVAGFSVVQDQSNLYTIKPSATVNKEAMPLYVNLDSELLPKSDCVIRYLYYFQNINLKETAAKTNLNIILKDMLPGTTSTNFFDLNDTYNALLITSKSNIIQGVMNILRELDQNGFRESIEVIPIFHTNAQEIVKIINDLIPKKSEDDQFRFPPLVSDSSQESKSYFSSSTRIVTISQTNSVAVFGLYDSVQRVKNFIHKYLDKKVDAEKTVLHVKPLQYLNAEKFEKTLTNLIEKKNTEAQSSGEVKEKVLSGVIVVAEKEQKMEYEERKLTEDTSDIGAKLETNGGEKQAPISGGNNLIIACTQKDWKIINKLIDDLDIEQWQVAIEVLIVDMTIESANQLGSQIRRINNDKNLHELKWQSAQLGKASLDYGDISKDTTIDNKAGIEADLLSQQPGGEKGYNLATSAPAGSTIFSFKDDNGMSIILSLLRNFSDTKIVSQPFVIARNNEQANILQKETRMVRGAVEDQSKGGTAVVKFEPMTASTLVHIRPRISKPANNINLEIEVNSSYFVGPSSIEGANEMRKRTVVTNANVEHKEVLILGGISEIEIKDSLAGSPILQRIPLIGYLFKNQKADHDHRNLMIFISPTRIAPVSATGKQVNKFTKEKINFASKKFRSDTLNFACPPDEEIKREENFQCLQDPVTNFLFHPKEGTWLGQALEFYADRGVWTQSMTGDTGKKQTKKPTPKTKTQPKQVSPKQVSPEQNTHKKAAHKAHKDKLKSLLQNQKNPFSKK